MKYSFSQQLQNRFPDIHKNSKAQTFKMIFFLSFLVGFILFLFLGKNFLEDAAILNVASLQEIKDNTIDKGDFGGYILWRRLLLLAVGFLLWWWGFGKLYVYGVLASCSFTMGACMYICLLRYKIKGLFLWFFLYFPHVLCYAAALFCGMIISLNIYRNKADKLKYLLQNGLIILLMLGLVCLGMYCESYINVALLQNFLQYF